MPKGSLAPEDRRQITQLLLAAERYLKLADQAQAYKVTDVRQSDTKEFFADGSHPTPEQIALVSIASDLDSAAVHLAAVETVLWKSGNGTDEEASCRKYYQGGSSEPHRALEEVQDRWLHIMVRHNSAQEETMGGEVLAENRSETEERRHERRVFLSGLMLADMHETLWRIHGRLQKYAASFYRDVPPTLSGMSARYRGRVKLLVLLALTAAAVMAFHDPIPQDPLYHDFVGDREVLGIRNFGNVASNLPFALVALGGLFILSRHGARRSMQFREVAEWRAYVVFFGGLLLTSIGSAYYHLAPGSERLVWDRLPLSIVFMSLLGIVIMERVSVKAGAWLFLPLLAAGAGSVLYWWWGENRGEGDLRWYACVQFYPVVAVPLMLALFPPRYTRAFGFVFLILAYLAAKWCEVMDADVLRMTHGLLSGHMCKHLVAALGAWWLLPMIRHRRPSGFTAE